MICLATDDADVKPYPGGTGWIVTHSSNDAVFAYCDTKDEAVAVREALNNLARVLREIGHSVT